MRNQFLIFSLAIYVCAHAQDNYTSPVSLTNDKELNNVESSDEQKKKSAENNIDRPSIDNDKISVTGESDLKIQQDLTRTMLFETNKNITKSGQEQNKLNDTLGKNSQNDSTIKASNKTSINSLLNFVITVNENEKPVNDLLKNATTDFSTANNTLNTTHTSSDSLHKNNQENSTTNENTIKNYPVNNSLGHETNKSDENVKLENNIINDNLKKNLSYSTSEANNTQIKDSTQLSKESDLYNYSSYNESVPTDEYINETSLSKDSKYTDDSDESTSETNTLDFDIGDLLDTYDISDMVDEDDDDEEDEEESDGEEFANFDGTNDERLKSDKPTTKKKVLQENKKDLNQKPEGLGIFPKIAIFSINVGFVFVAFWLTKKFIHKKVFQEVFSPNIPPNGYVACNSEIFLHKSVQVVILKQPFTQNHKTTEYLGVWFF